MILFIKMYILFGLFSVMLHTNIYIVFHSFIYVSLYTVFPRYVEKHMIVV